MKVRVTFDYDPVNDDELLLRVGQTVRVTNPSIFEGWMEGELDGKVGVFPENFVEEVKDEPEKPPPPARPKAPSQSSAALPAAVPAAEPPPVEDEAALRKPKKVMPPTGGIGDVMSQLGKRMTKSNPAVNDEPKEPAPPSPTATVPSASAPVGSSGGGGKPRCKAHHAYEATQGDELSFDVGDVVEVENQDDKDWWQGTLNGKQGWFPTNFVDMLPDEDQDTKMARRPSHGFKVLPTVLPGAAQLKKVESKSTSDVSKPEEPTPTAPTFGASRLSKKISREVVDVPPKQDDAMPEWMRRRREKMGEIPSASNDQSDASPAPAPAPAPAAKPSSPKSAPRPGPGVKPAPKPAPAKEETKTEDGGASETTAQTRKWTPKGLPSGAVPLFPGAGSLGRSGPPPKATPPPAEKGVDMNAPSAAPVLDSVAKKRIGAATGRRPPSRHSTQSRTSTDLEGGDDEGKGVGEVAGQVLELLGLVQDLRKQLEGERKARLELEERVAQLEAQ
eukprot:comp23552_c0_seq1/m.39767 comp23552_c0_seq1/g.39767  ORF comp23552_c0_seq1/g.39767 comp23552_c0_seq1/m.39767 type:complete len:503 (-) comp23552_c0_seq1:26-1534(-)